MKKEITVKKVVLMALLLDVIIILIPIALNFILNRESPIPQQYIIGDAKDWLSFWGVYIGSIGSLIMAGVAFVTIMQNNRVAKQNEALLAQNKEQLYELKRQWEEQNKPVLSSTLSVSDNDLFLEIVNTSSVHASVDKCVIDNHTSHIKDDFSKLNAALENICLELPPHYSKMIMIPGIEPHKVGDYGDDYISVSIVYGDNRKTFNLYLREITIMKWHVTKKDMADKLASIADEIKCKN